MDNITGNRLREILDARDIKQKEFSQMCGIHEVSISRYINGSYHPKLNTLKKMADALGVSVAYLEGWETLDEIQELSVQGIIDSDLDFSIKLKALLSSYDEFYGYKFTSDDIVNIMDYIRFMIVKR